MSRKEYERLAMIVREARIEAQALYMDNYEAHARIEEGIGMVVRHMIKNLATENPRFNARTFRNACDRDW